MKKLIMFGLSAATALSMTGGALMPIAGAATIAELQASIAAIQAQIAAMGGSSSAACYAFTLDLTEGSTGADVTALQNYLAGTGHFTVTATGFFGPITKAAVAAWQTANGVAPAYGYFGPISQAKYTSLCSAAVPDEDDDDDDTTPSDLDGGAGALNDVDYISSLTNEEVGEDEEDAEVAGLVIEADDSSDIELTAVRLNFSDTGGANNDDDFDEYASEVSVWFEGEEVGRVDADTFTDDNNYDKTISLDSGAIIRAGEEAELIVAVSGPSNLDGLSAGDDWSVEFESVRFEDGQGAITTDDATGDINDGAGRTFSFETYATAVDVELKLSSDDATINDAHVINVHATDDTDDVELLSFEIEIDGDSDVNLDELVVVLTSTEATGNDPADLVHTLNLLMEDEEIGVESTTDAGADSTETLTFDNLDTTLEAGETYGFIVTGDFFSIADALDAGDLISVDITAVERALIEAEDESGEDLAAADMTGTATGGTHSLQDVGMNVTLVGTPTAVISHTGDIVGSGAGDDDQGTFTITFDVTPFDGNVYIDGTMPTLAGGATESDLDLVTTGTAALTSALISSPTGATMSGVVNVDARFLVEEDETERFTVTAVATQTADGQTHVAITNIRYALTDVSGTTSFTFNLDDFKTPDLNMNAN